MRKPKLTPAEVQQIRWIRKDIGASYGELARHFGVSLESIARIIRREVWQSVPDIPPRKEDNHGDV